MLATVTKAAANSFTDGVWVAVGAMLVGTFGWLLRQGFVSAVRREIAPIHDRIDSHMEREEASLDAQEDALRDISAALVQLNDQNKIEHGEFRRRLDRLES